MKFDFSQDYELEDEIIRLIPLAAGHLEYLLPFSLQEPEIWQFNADGAAGAENLKKYIDTAIKQRQNEKEYPFIVFDKRINKYIGCTRFYNIDLTKKILEIGYTWYGKDFQGTGANKNCKYLLLDFAFSHLDMERVGFSANRKNERSINAMKSIGCTVEGILRSRSLDAKGERIDSMVLSILKKEWQDDGKLKLKDKTVKR